MCLDLPRLSATDSPAATHTPIGTCAQTSRTSPPCWHLAISSTLTHRKSPTAPVRQATHLSVDRPVISRAFYCSSPSPHLSVDHPVLPGVVRAVLRSALSRRRRVRGAVDLHQPAPVHGGGHLTAELLDLLEAHLLVRHLLVRPAGEGQEGHARHLVEVLCANRGVVSGRSALCEVYRPWQLAVCDGRQKGWSSVKWVTRVEQRLYRHDPSHPRPLTHHTPTRRRPATPSRRAQTP